MDIKIVFIFTNSDQLNRTKSLEINPHIYSQLVLTKMPRAVFSVLVRKLGISVPKNKIQLLPHIIYNINTKCIKD
jgi:hypothetical protein